MTIEYALLKESKQTCLEEQKNLGHENWNPLEHTDWLLLEIDSNMLFRPGQIEVTLATIKPAGGSNSVLQMNISQGKTSCIMPMAAAVLANGDNLVRVIIPKSLLVQTAQLLHSRLGGLLGREFRHVPFSRKTSTQPETIKAFFDVHKAMRSSRGLMLALPEHLLSFKLSGLQRMSDGLMPEASSMIRIQSWLERHSRDILDEVDYILAVRTQLIYPSGSQKSMDGHPHRWETIEALLKQVNLHLWNLQKAYPRSIEVVPRDGGGFPLVYFLRKDVEEELIRRLVDDVYRGRGSLLPDVCNKSDRLAVKHFISLAKPSMQAQERIRQLFPDKPAIKKVIFQLRGLLVHRILLMCLKKRWSVQYGLHPTRDPIAVPFHAKGTPTEQSEWGHPDVFLLFTCLAFYYDGLNLTQLRQALEHVLKSDDPSQVYDVLSQTSKLPDFLRDWTAVNIDDAAQLHEIWTHVRRQVIVIDYFLNNFVFPQHAKQFQLKLQASGWDIPLSLVQCSESLHGQPTKSLTTGFSGTNDWKRMLPLTIKQQDLPGLAHTNAEVLTYLLQPRSRRYEIAADHRGKRLTEVELLGRFRNKGIRVFIDAGAQILEMDNLTLAKTWPEIHHEAPAVVYFNKSNKPFVLYPKGHQVPLLASPYANDLGGCLVYLDEAHTRGTDLKMPETAIGALTLRLGQTKDHTVQAAMRLRQLATTQAVVLFAPPEVHQSIIDVRKKKSFDHIDSFDVICWLLEQTCSEIEQLQPLYFLQGIDYCRRAQAALDNPYFLVDPDQREAYLTSLREFEQRTLEQMYGIASKVKHSVNPEPFFPNIASFTKELNRQRKSFQDTGNAVHGSALQEVEQEREVAFEVESVREMQKPIHYLPYSFPGLSRDIISFARTGHFTADSSAYEEAFTALRKTSLSRKYNVSSEGVSGKLYVSTEFTKTVKIPSDRSYDNFLRSVNWLLWSPSTEIAMIIIPEEADALLHTLYGTQQPLTHLLTYASPISRKMLHFNNLTFYSVPKLPQSWKAPGWLRVELGIIAGRLYFQYEEYDALCKYLCVKENSHGLEEENGEEDDDDGATYVLNTSEEDEGLTQSHSAKSFTKKPLVFMQEWLAIKRKGQDFSQSPMGYVCQGKPLGEDHPFFVTAEAPRKQKALMTTTTRLSEEEDNEDPDIEFYDADEYGPDVGNDDFDDADLTDGEDDVIDDSS
ncbi:hypothetical protein BJ875DRAFT_521350 [Amylocarpus encephaloides]|uniref:ubiquitinyl hydrolase 1 n=1 Tax=Amylocarpus encephaloides TaxID=45428 RepID=A0A9P7YA79_9HELO|nr:hypothetical protein BJ875DRAFT_521350 [Amylocarpus encephaloides]